MADTKATTGKAVTFGIGNGVTPTEVFTALAEVTSINGIGVELGTTDATHLGSGDYDEFIATIMKNKTITIGINFVPGSGDETALLAAFASQAFKNYQVVYPSGAKYTNKMLMTGFDQGEVTREGKLTATATFMPRGAPTRLAAT
jgi:hypothetical protein